VNNNAYQISRALHHNGRTGQNIDALSHFVKADFMAMPFEADSFDAIYQVRGGVGDTLGAAGTLGFSMACVVGSPTHPVSATVSLPLALHPD
jgi:hypothetical protein